jgi:hypothetical protein
MSARYTLIALFLALFMIGCSSGSSAEKDESATAEMETTSDDMSDESEAESDDESMDSKDESAELAACTGGNVPEGAENCLLDLGTGKNTYWSDTDGVDPGTAGCHDEYMSDSCDQVKEGRTFGEFCLDDDRLVESNPGAGVCHTHGNDMGKPDVVSCSEWCQSESGTSGKCEGGVTAEAAAGTCESARCVCDSA